MAKEMSGQSLPMKVLMKLRLKCLYHPKNLSEEQEQKKNMCVRWELLAGAASHVFWGFLEEVFLNMKMTILGQKQVYHVCLRCLLVMRVPR